MGDNTLREGAVRNKFMVGSEMLKNLPEATQLIGVKARCKLI